MKISADQLSSHPDAYHSCYTLAGLSAVQHQSRYRVNRVGDVSTPLGAAMQWVPPPQDQDGKDDANVVYDSLDRVCPLHPIFVIPWPAVRATREYYRQRGTF